MAFVILHRHQEPTFHQASMFHSSCLPKRSDSGFGPTLVLKPDDKVGIGVCQDTWDCFRVQISKQLYLQPDAFVQNQHKKAGETIFEFLVTRRMTEPPAVSKLQSTAT